MGAAPSGEVVTFDPDQAFTHTSSAFGARWDWSSVGDGWHTSRERAWKGELLPFAEDYFPRKLRAGKVT
jgi:hypothetical protein